MSAERERERAASLQLQKNLNGNKETLLTENLISPGLSRVVKLPGRVVDQPPPYNAEVKERVGLYLYYPLPGSSWPVIG